MDILRPRPKITWRDTLWWQATEQSLVSCLQVTGLATPFILYFATQLMRLSHQRLDTRLLFSELAKGSLAMLPYLWAYFFALERIARQRSKDYPQYLE
jgi:hypothetical protein